MPAMPPTISAECSQAARACGRFALTLGEARRLLYNPNRWAMSASESWEGYAPAIAISNPTAAARERLDTSSA